MRQPGEGAGEGGGLTTAGREGWCDQLNMLVGLTGESRRARISRLIRAPLLANVSGPLRTLSTLGLM